MIRSITFSAGYQRINVIYIYINMKGCLYRVCGNIVDILSQVIGWLSLKLEGAKPGFGNLCLRIPA